uniref:Uncharacterized protein n=1 Tax=Arion vulgaris TaxID=1028688 RepID=A0A0B7A577_9EUPU
MFSGELSVTLARRGPGIQFLSLCAQLPHLTWQFDERWHCLTSSTRLCDSCGLFNKPIRGYIPIVLLSSRIH